MFLVATIALVAAAAPPLADGRRRAGPSRTVEVSIEDVDARATIAGCIAREASARNLPQASPSDPKVRAEIERQAKDPRRLERCRRVLADD